MGKADIVRRIYSKRYIDKLIVKVKLLGTKNKIDIYDLIISRLLLLLIVFIVIIFNFDYGYIIAPGIVILLYYLFNKVTLDDKIKNRGRILESEAIHFFEVLTLSLETGRNLQQALEVTTSNVNGLLSDEFKEAVREVQFGKSLNEVLSDMHERIPSETINNIILSLTESNLYGNSIIKNLYNQIDFLREKRKMEVKGKISKVPILISVISVLFFIPLVLLLIIGPIVLEYLN